MRRIALAGMLIVVAAGIAADASARDALGPVSCGSATKVTYFFFPHGNTAVPAANLAAHTNPNLAVYNGTALVAATTSDNGGFAPGCKAAKAGHALPLTHPKSTTANGMLTCTFARAPQHLVAKTAGGTLLTSLVPQKTGKPRVEVAVAIGVSSSKLSFDSKVCKLGVAPAPPQMMQFSFQGLSGSFDGGNAHWILTFSGTHCGPSIRGPWTITTNVAIAGGTVNGQPPSQTVDLTSGTGSFTALKFSDNSGSATAQLQLADGPPPSVTLTMSLAGVFSGLAINPGTAQVASTPVASC